MARIGRPGRPPNKRATARVMTEIARYIINNHTSPSLAEIQRALGYHSAATIHAHVKKLIAKGFLHSEPRKHRSLRLSLVAQDLIRQYAENVERAAQKATEDDQAIDDRQGNA